MYKANFMDRRTNSAGLCCLFVCPHFADEFSQILGASCDVLMLASLCGSRVGLGMGVAFIP